MDFNIVNKIKLSYSRKGNSEKLISCSLDAVDVFRQYFDLEEIDYRESFFALYLNQANKVLGIKKISESGISSTIVDVRIIMQAALLCNATAIILAHNQYKYNVLNFEFLCLSISFSTINFAIPFFKTLNEFQTLKYIY